MKYLASSILVLYVYFTGTGQATTKDFIGFCAYPCFSQNEVYQNVENYYGRDLVINSSDPTIITAYDNGTFYLNLECFMRSGPLFAQRVEMEGNLTHAQYRCVKYVNDDVNGDIVIGWATDLEVFEDYPSICDVCYGEGFLPVHVVKKETADCRVVIVPGDMGCNLPLVCPVTNPELQVQCTCDDEIFDNGFCCPEN